MSSAKVRQSGAPQAPQSLRGSRWKISFRRLALWMAWTGSASKGGGSSGLDGIMEGQKILVVEQAHVGAVDHGPFSHHVDQAQDPAFRQEAVLDGQGPPMQPSGQTVHSSRSTSLRRPISTWFKTRIVSRTPETATVRWFLSPRVSPPERAVPTPMPLKMVSGKRWAHDRLFLVLPEGLMDRFEDVPDGNGAVQVGFFHRSRVVDRDHFRRTGRDMDDPDVRPGGSWYPGEIGPQDLGRDLPRRLDGDDMFAERAESAAGSGG